MLGWGSKPVAPKPSILPELETPATREEFETLINKKYHLLLDLESDAGWTRVPFTDNDIELFERKSEEFPAWDIVKVRTTIKAPLQKLWEMINCHDVETVKAWQPDLQGEKHIEGAPQPPMLVFSSPQTDRLVAQLWERTFVWIT
jgi:hypothetical protein